MCGISGIYLNKGTSDIPNIDKNNFRTSDVQKLKATVEKMNQSQARRGPDDEGVFLNEDGRIAFGHRRLSILDLSEAGHQPMQFKIQNSKFKIQSELWITYNGEIYNFLELKKDLEKKGYKFKTKTDTEVILALYSEYGEKSFSMLRGMFAFGLWDGYKQKLFLVKDRYGIKPLYYYSDKEKLIFASTVKAIAESGLISVEKNSDAWIGFLLFGSVPLPMTTVKNVFAVPAGYYLVRETDGNQKLVKYYEPLEFFNTRTSDVPRGSTSQILSKIREEVEPRNIIQNIRRFLQESVNLHLISDAPLGVFLSGGLDSSAIAALAAKSLENQHQSAKIGINQRLKTLSIIFDEKEFSEEYYSDLVAKKINSDHRKAKITKQDFFESFDEIFEAMDQPTIDGVNTFFIAKAAKQAGLKTVLSGLGADEIFLGYPHFRRAKLLRKIQNFISIFGHRKSLGLAMSRILNLLGDRYSKLSYFANDDVLSFYLGIRGLFSPKQTARILDTSLNEVNNFISNIRTSDILNIDGNIRMSDVQRLNPVNLLSYLELKFYLQNQLLKDTDFMSMHHSVEVRVPFLDHRLVEYVSSLLPEVKLNMGKSDLPNIDANFRRSDFQKLNKPLLAAAVQDLLPQEIFSRPKMGFTFPFQKWLKEGLPMSQKLTSILRTSEVQKFKFGKSHWSRFWAKVVLSKFL